MIRPARTGPISGLFFLSGAASLLYQVVWVRLFVHEFGATVLAVSTVLAAFMGGLALGGLFAGRWSERARNPLRAYGWLELSLAIYALAVPLLLRGLDPLYASAYPRLEGSFALLSALRFALSACVLLPPTILMGATLPLLIAHTSRAGTTRSPVALLYAINTFGATFGTVAASFFLLPSWGLRNTLHTGVVVNVAVGLAALALARRSEGNGVGEPAPTDAPPLAGELSRAWLLAAVGVLGFSALAFEVLWTRTLTLALGTTTYAFAIVLSVFLLGIASGSTAATRLLRDPARAARAFRVAPAAIGLLALAALPLFDRLPALFVHLSSSGSATWTRSLFVEFALAALPLLPPTFVSGAALPLAIGLDRAHRASRSTGDLYAANTFGAILGSWAGGFVLLPTLGLRGGIELAAILPVLVSAAFFLRSRSRTSRWVAASLLTSVALLVVLLPDWNRAALTRGGFAIGVELRRTGRTELAPDRARLVFHEEGVTSTITVRQFRKELTMQMNGVTEASNTGDYATQVMAGTLPALLHPAPRDAMVIGLGSGITTSAVARVPGMTSVDCLEISEAVVHAARLFHESNHEVLDDPRVHVIVGDGRNHLRLSGRQYDLIVSEPSNVWNSGIGSLMTSEFFGLARDGLRPGGILCSWIQGYSLSPEALRSVLAAAESAFPRVSLWMGGWGDLLIVAGDESLQIDVSLLLERGKDPEFAELLRDIDCPDLLVLLSHNLLAGASVTEYVAGMPANTDDNNYLEFAAPKLLYRETMNELFDGLHAASGGIEPWITGVAATDLTRELPRLRKARELESKGRLALREAKGVDGVIALDQAHRSHPTAPAISRFLSQALVSRGSALCRQGNLRQGVQQFRRAAELDPGSGEPFAALAETYADAAQPTEALEAIEEAIRRQDDNPDFRAVRAGLLVRTHAFDDAERDAREALEQDPWIHDAYVALGDALEGRDQLAAADSVYGAGLARFPDSPELASRQRKVSAQQQRSDPR